jgi:hypothetical protein
MCADPSWREELSEHCPECGGELLVRTRRWEGLLELDVSFEHSSAHCGWCWDVYEGTLAEVGGAVVYG